MQMLDIDEIQATHPRHAAAQAVRPGTAEDRRRVGQDRAEIADLKDILEKPERQRAIVRDELAEIVDKYGDERRTKIVATTAIWPTRT